MYSNVYPALLITKFNPGEFSGGEKVPPPLTTITKPTTPFLTTQLAYRFQQFTNYCKMNFFHLKMSVTALVQLPQRNEAVTVGFNFFQQNITVLHTKKLLSPWKLCYEKFTDQW